MNLILEFDQIDGDLLIGHERKRLLKITIDGYSSY
jgi:hypothetical protein